MTNLGLAEAELTALILEAASTEMLLAVCAELDIRMISTAARRNGAEALFKYHMLLFGGDCAGVSLALL